MNEETIQIDTRGLDKLIRSLKLKAPVARVGILGGKVRKEGNSNAEIGSFHEFGTDKLPVRSFLRVPISDKLEVKMEESGSFEVENIVNQGSLLNWTKEISVLAEGIVLEAFGSGGFGKWKPSEMKYKKNHQTLVETQQLRNSITSEVKS